MFHAIVVHNYDALFIYLWHSAISNVVTTTAVGLESHLEQWHRTYDRSALHLMHTIALTSVHERALVCIADSTTSASAMHAGHCTCSKYVIFAILHLTRPVF